MALYDSPPHRVAIYSVASATDSGGGTTLSYTLKQSAVPCSINTASASEREMFAQQQIVVTHTIAFKSSAITTSLVRGDKIVAADESSRRTTGARTTSGASGRAARTVACRRSRTRTSRNNSRPLSLPLNARTAGVTFAAVVN